VTAHVPGVHAIVIAVGAAVPVHCCGPVTESFPSDVTVPVNPLNGAANVSEQSVCVTTAFWPMRDASQCCVIFHVPATFGHAVPPLDEDDDDDVDVPDEPDDPELELELHAARSVNATIPAYLMALPFGSARQSP
jgi:hypothetical protein